MPHNSYMLALVAVVVAAASNCILLSKHLQQKAQNPGLSFRCLVLCLTYTPALTLIFFNFYLSQYHSVYFVTFSSHIQWRPSKLEFFFRASNDKEFYSEKQVQVITQSLTPLKTKIFYVWKGHAKLLSKFKGMSWI